MDFKLPTVLLTMLKPNAVLVKFVLGLSGAQDNCLLNGRRRRGRKGTLAGKAQRLCPRMMLEHKPFPTLASHISNHLIGRK